MPRPQFPVVNFRLDGLVSIEWGGDGTFITLTKAQWDDLIKVIFAMTGAKR